jgi:hypothetical protein
MNVLDIKIVRMKTGEDVIGYVSDISDAKFNIKNPMEIDVVLDERTNEQAFIMKSWLPHQLFKNNDVSIWTNDTFFMADATDEFIVYYEKMVKKIEQYLLGEEILDELDEDDIYQAMIELDESVVH